MEEKVMTNYEKIKSMNRAQIGKFLTEFSIEDIIPDFCEVGCPVRDKCQTDNWNEETDKCPTDGAMMCWWLDQEVNSK